MAWNRWCSLKSYVRSSLWVAPILALVLQIGVERLANRLGGWMASQGWYEARTSFFWVSASEAHGLLDRIFNLSLSCLVFAFGSLLVAIQVVGGQYTPRIIAAAILRDNVIRSIVVLFSFTLLWAHRTTLQLGQGPDIPQYQVFFASLLGIGSLIAFIVLIDYCARSLRPVSIVKRVGNHGIAVIQSVYPQPAKDVPEHEIITVGKKKWRNRPRLSSSEMTDATLAVARGVAARVIHHKGRSAIIMAVNLQALVTEARRADCLIEFAPQIGDFLGTEDPLFYLYGHVDAVDPERLRNLVALEQASYRPPTVSSHLCCNCVVTLNGIFTEVKPLSGRNAAPLRLG